MVGTDMKQGKKKGEKIHLGDWPAVKRTIDDQVIEALKRTGYDVDYLMVDIRSGLGILAVVIACVAQFWPGENKNAPGVLVPCVAGYMMLSGLMWLMQFVLYKDIIAHTKSLPGNPGVELKSKMKRYGDRYTLQACMKGDSVVGVRESSSTEYVGRFFNEDAEVQVEAISALVNDVLHQLDVPSESSNGNSKKDT